MGPIHLLPLLVSTADSGQSQWLAVLFLGLPSLIITFTARGNDSASLQCVCFCVLLDGGRASEGTTAPQIVLRAFRALGNAGVMFFSKSSGFP